MMSAVSVFIITRNEEIRLPRTLAALGWADEVVVVDSGSTDRTCEIARKAGARVEHRDWTGYGPQKVHAEGLCRNDWILNVDADEVVTPDLAGEILNAAAGPPGVFRVRILNLYPGDERPRPFANDYNVVRLYHRSVAGYRDHPVFDRVDVGEGAMTGQLRAPILHHTVIDWENLVEKENRHSSFQAREARPRSAILLRIRLFFEFPAVFLKFWILRRHITGGWKGFTFSLIAAFARTLRIAKMLEKSEGAEKSR